MPRPKAPKSVELPAHRFALAWRNLNVLTDPSRTGCNSVAFDVHRTGVRLIATDAHALGWSWLAETAEPPLTEDPWWSVVPDDKHQRLPQFVAMLAKLGQPPSGKRAYRWDAGVRKHVTVPPLVETVTVALQDERVTFTANDESLTLPVSRFPDWRRLATTEPAPIAPALPLTRQRGEQTDHWYGEPLKKLTRFTFVAPHVCLTPHSFSVPTRFRVPAGKAPAIDGLLMEMRAWKSVVDHA